MERKNEQFYCRSHIFHDQVDFFFLSEISTVIALVRQK